MLPSPPPWTAPSPVSRLSSSPRQLGDRLLWSQLDLELRSRSDAGWFGGASGAGQNPVAARAWPCSIRCQPARNAICKGRPAGVRGSAPLALAGALLTSGPRRMGERVSDLRSPWSFQERRRAGGWAGARDQDWLAALGRDSRSGPYETPERPQAAELQLLAAGCGPCSSDPIVLLLG